ncbi:hypothetical protein, partial [Enterococcus faecium]
GVLHNTKYAIVQFFGVTMIQFGKSPAIAFFTSFYPFFGWYDLSSLQAVVRCLVYNRKNKRYVACAEAFFTK